MLRLKNIIKDYETGGEKVHALKGVSINFRSNEFVSVLGQSGCGKTTLLNIIGGLDQYTKGDLVIKGKSTKKYKDKDWDSYRNHSIGFVFQSYNLIMHQSVLSNVELALTLSGVSKSERRKRAKEVLEKVGLKNQISKKPNQLSGGQMQRVAIARALINDPEILLADEPTGALDTETSVQIMDLLKEIADDRLVIMVTHNPELAENYSTRIIKLLDGEVIDDSNPYTDEEAEKVSYEEEDKKKNKKNRMSYFTALGLSFNNLLTKKGRTILTAFAGSIGIIGIALILSLSSGFRNYISSVEQDTLSTYPLEITDESVDRSAMFSMLLGNDMKSSEEHDMDKVYSNNFVGDYMNTLMSEVKINDMISFMDYIENGDGQVIKKYASDIMYTYGIKINAYLPDTDNDIYQVNPGTVMDKIGMGSMAEMSQYNIGSSMDMTSVWSEIIENQDLLNEQYDVIAGRWPENYDELVLVVSEYNEITDYELYTLGLRDVKELQDMVAASLKGEIVTYPNTSYTYDELLNLTYKVIPTSDYYAYDEAQGCYVDMSDDYNFLKDKIDNGIEVKVVGIVRPNEDAAVHSIMTTIGYKHALAQKLMEMARESDIGKEQLANPDINVFTGYEFGADVNAEKQEDTEKMIQELAKQMAEQFGVSDLSEVPEEQLFEYMHSVEPVQAMMILAVLPEDKQASYMASLSEEEMAAFMSAMDDTSSAAQGMSQGMSLTALKKAEDATYDDNLTTIGIAYENDPESIKIYPKDFDSKEKIISIIDEYNEKVRAAGEEDKEISFEDMIGTMMSSISTIINAISYVLIAFVAISLVVSSIMIGIITYISVLERTKEIGVLRSIGASKKDISRVFNAETIIVGFIAGVIGIVVTIALNVPINKVIKNVSGLSHISRLPIKGAAILIIISVVLTMIAGLIPSRVASKKDPVVALRTE
ncbi:MAG: ABC transporter ATP-binding protein/permease [Lachnospiraceae bacterium]|nr:ABC transporter ATP-binding protein/permease [Lachnospiraceae bacterium]